RPPNSNATRSFCSIAATPSDSAGRLRRQRKRLHDPQDYALDRGPVDSHACSRRSDSGDQCCSRDAPTHAQQDRRDLPSGDYHSGIVHACTAWSQRHLGRASGVDLLLEPLPRDWPFAGGVGDSPGNRVCSRWCERTELRTGKCPPVMDETWLAEERVTPLLLLAGPSPERF